MSLSDTILLPGEAIPSHQIATDSKRALTIGPNLRHLPPSTIISNTSGALLSDLRKPSLWVENNGGCYIPTTGDLVICTVHHSGGEAFMCTITPYTPYATLGHLEFEGANRKTRPQLPPNSIVYARIASAHPHPPHQDPTLTCISPTTGKADGMGPLKGGMVFTVSLGLARRLLSGKRGKVIALDELAERGVRFEVAVGKNGFVWVDGEKSDVKITLAVGKMLQKVDTEMLNEEEQIKLAEKVARGLKS